MTPLPPREWHPRRQDGESVRALLERKLVIEQRHLEDVVAACAPAILKDHQVGRVAMLKELIAQLSEQQQVVGDV